MNTICKNCGNKITISIFKGGDWCCDDCRKALEKKHKAIATNGVYMFSTKQQGVRHCFLAARDQLENEMWAQVAAETYPDRIYFFKEDN